MKMDVCMRSLFCLKVILKWSEPSPAALGMTKITADERN